MGLGANLLLDIVALLGSKVENAEWHTGNKPTQMSVNIDIGARQYVHDWKSPDKDKENQENVPIWSHSVIVQPIPNGKGAHQSKNCTTGAHSDSVWFENRWKHISFIST